jgi:hypothetical protein
MAWIFNGKHFGGYTFEHWFDDDAKSGADEQDDIKLEIGNPPPPQDDAPDEKEKETQSEAPPPSLTFFKNKNTI